jgi:hypothetical protein
VAVVYGLDTFTVGADTNLGAYVANWAGDTSTILILNADDALSTTGYNSNRKAWYTGAGVLGDQRVSGTVWNNGSGGSSVWCSGFLTRFDANGNGYAAEYTGASDATYRLNIYKYTNNGGTKTLVANSGTSVTNIALPPTTWYAASFEAVGTTTTVLTFRVGQFEITYSDSSSPLTSGYPGVVVAEGNSGYRGLVDDLRIENTGLQAGVSVYPGAIRLGSNGASRITRVADIAATTSFTWMAWLKLNAPYAAMQGIFNMNRLAGSGEYYLCYGTANANFNFPDTTGGNGASGTPVLGAWTHVALRYSAADGALYQNGALVYSTGWMCGVYTPGNLVFGDADGGSWAATMDVAALKIWDRPLSLAEIQTEMRCAMPVSSLALNSFYPMPYGLPTAEATLSAYSPDRPWTVVGTVTAQPGPPIAWSLSPMVSGLSNEWRTPNAGAGAQQAVTRNFKGVMR